MDLNACNLRKLNVTNKDLRLPLYT